jgi:hypothetical protein
MKPPPAVATLFESLGEGHVDCAAGAFADDALCAYPDDVADEAAARSTARGRDCICRAFATCGGGPPEPVVCVHEDADCFVEGRLTGATLVASLQLDANGAIARCLSFRCPEVEPPPTWGAGESARPGAARATLERYLRHLTAGEFAEACGCFSEDCLYSHPPYSPDAPRAEFRGRGELLAGFERTRGPRPGRPEILCCVQRGSECFIEGVVSGIPNGGSFVSSVLLDREGLIRRYVAFYSKSRVPRRGA